MFDSETDKIEVLNDTLIGSWDEYVKDHWVWHGKFDPYRMNYEDKTKALLDRCGTFLLLGDFHNNNITRDLDEVYKSEVPMSQSESEYDVEFDMLPFDDIVLTHTQPHHKQKKKVEKRYRNSQSYKISRIFSFDEKYVSHKYKLKNKDVYDRDLIPVEADKNWKNRTFKNIYGDPVFESRIKKVDERVGIIDPTIPYESKWCYVKTDNTFEYGGMVYKIHRDVTQYAYDSATDMYLMDKILVFVQDEKMYFFDMNIDQIDNCNIQMLQKVQ